MKYDSIRSTINFVLVFMLVFAFPIGNVSSSKFAVLLVYVMIFFKGRISRKISILFAKKNIILYLVIYAFVILYFLVITISFGEFDFSLIYKLISSITFTILVFLFFVILDSNKILNYIIGAFVIQSLIILLAILNKDFYDLMGIFRKGISIRHIESYGRMRGNAMSGYQFFGIGTMYGFVIIYSFLVFNLTRFKDLSILFLFVLVGFISSRYTIIASTIGFSFWIIFRVSFKERAKVLTYGIIISLIVLIIINYAYYNLFSEKLVRTINYQILHQTEMFIKGDFSKVSSLNHMMEMYKNIEFENILFGEGRYISSDGLSYYKKVDIGYIRILIYGGIVGLSLMIYLIYFFLFNILKYRSTNRLLKYAFFMYFIFLNFKGDVFLYSNNIIPLLTGLLFFYNSDDEKRNLR